MRSFSKTIRDREEIDSISLQNKSMSFLLEASVDRSSFDSALRSIEPMSDLEDLMKEVDPLTSNPSMPKTAKAIRDAINRVNRAISSSPDPILSIVGLDNKQKELIDAITAAEVLKFSILNSMDAVRMLFINDFKKNLRIFDDEAISYNVVPNGSLGLKLSTPQRVPFSVANDVRPYEIHSHGRTFMTIGPETSGPGNSVSLRVPGSTRSLTIQNVNPGKIYMTGRNTDGEPVPINKNLKQLFLKIPPPSSADIDLISKKIGKIAEDREFNLEDTVTKNFKIPQPAEGTIVSIYRAIRRTSSIAPVDMPANDLFLDMKAMSLERFKKIFNAFVVKTSSSTGDMSTYDLTDTLFFSGLAAVSGMLGTAPPPGPSAEGSAGASPAAPARDGTAASAPASGASGGSGGRGGGGGSGPGGGARHSLNNIFSDPTIASGATPAARATNLNTLKNSINQDALRNALNTLTGGSVVFTESTVDRWSELAGIKESK